MIKKLIIIIFFLFILNFNYLPVYRAEVRLKTPVVFTIESDKDKYTSVLIEKNKKYYQTEMIFLYLSFRINTDTPENYFNSS